MAKRILSFLKKHNILYKLQFGFGEGHSTTHTLLELLEELYSNLDQGNTCIGIFLDLTKAFDTIDHDILLFKLQHYGFRGKIYDWFSSYLKNRKQFTIANGESSKLDYVYKGAPQGSVLGPILFILYVNDIPNATKLIPRLFADDTNVFNFGKCIPNLIHETNTQLSNLTLFHLGGGVFRPPNQTFLHCAETAQDMMTKLCDFYSNLIGNQNLNASLF